MATKDDPNKKHLPVMGWFTPHYSFDWTGLVPDPKTGELVKEPSMTKQSFVAECDINNIIKEFSVTGIAQHINQRQGLFIDLPDALDFQQSLNVVQQAGEAFASLPAQVRARFDNDPEAFLMFLHDPANLAEAKKLGLVKDDPPKPGTAAPAQDPPASSPQDPPKT